MLLGCSYKAKYSTINTQPPNRITSVRKVYSAGQHKNLVLASPIFTCRTENFDSRGWFLDIALFAYTTSGSEGMTADQLAGTWGKSYIQKH